MEGPRPTRLSRARGNREKTTLRRHRRPLSRCNLG